MPSREEWTLHAASLLSNAGIASAKLDAELLLAHALQITRTALHAHFDDPLPGNLVEILNTTIDLRISRVPLAYILGHKEFYGRLFRVTPDVLIPRPESEGFIDILKTIDRIGVIIDVGTGSGILAITSKLETTGIKVIGLDISEKALSVARSNAKAYDATTVDFQLNDLLNGLERPATSERVVIMANLPYVSRDWTVSAETHYEPESALYANEGGEAMINQLLYQSNLMLIKNDILLIESDTRQHSHIAKTAGTLQFECSGRLGLVQQFIKL